MNEQRQGGVETGRLENNQDASHSGSESETQDEGQFVDLKCLWLSK